MGKIFYINNPSRAHKLLPLLEGIPLQVIERWEDLLALRRAAKPGNIILIDSLGRFGVIGFCLSLLLRAPLVVRLRGDFFREERERARARTGWFRWIRYGGSIFVAKLCLWRANMLIFNSEYLSRLMAPYARGKLSGIVRNPYTPLEPMRNNEDTCELPQGGFRLLTVTNMGLRSKMQPIADAICDGIPANLWEELDIYWVICGTGCHEERLRKLVAEKALGGRVQVLGRVKNTSELYAWCDVVIHLTRMDAFPNVPMEAMMSGKPVIVNEDSCGTREQVFDGVNGFVVKDAEAFIEALRAYAGDRKLREQHAKAGKLLVEEEFSVATQRREMHSVLAKLDVVKKTDV